MTRRDKALEIYDALSNHAPRRLASKAFRAPDGDRCALGVLYKDEGDGPNLRRLLWLPFAAMMSLFSSRFEGDAFELEAMCENDDYEGTPEDRYNHMRAWASREAGLVSFEMAIPTRR